MRGFNRRGIYRMVQFYETYTAPAFLNLFHENRLSAALQENSPAAPTSLVQISGNKEIENVSALLTQISWTNHLLILGGKRTPQERLFYLLLSCRERLSSRELKRQIDTCMFERTMASTSSMTEGLKLLPSAPGPLFRDSYSLELLGLPLVHDENELRKRIVANLKEFFLEFGRDFTFVGEEYRLQVGGHDYYCDLLLFHRELRALVAVELKAKEFDPRDFGQLEFYLSVLDHDHRKPFENPSIGLLLCKEKDDAVVRYAIGHSTSPAILSPNTVDCFPTRNSSARS